MKSKTGSLSAFKTNTLFGGLSKKSLERLISVVQTKRYSAGKTVFHQGDPANGCYAVLSGAVKVILPGTSGAETLLAVLGKGDIIGEMALIDRKPRSATVMAIKACELGHIALRDFERIADQDTEIYRHLLVVLSARIRASNETFSLQQLPLRERLACILFRLSEGFGEPLPDGRIMIRQKFSQAQIAEMAGCARENVNRILKSWSRDGHITRLSGYYCLSENRNVSDLAGE